MSEQNNPAFLVWDIREIVSVCSPEELDLLNNIIERVLNFRQQSGKDPVSRYIVVSEEEPYFNTVKDMIDMIKGKK